jgi:energy-coupling factor transporter ATP-binding protein EcfA2
LRIDSCIVSFEGGIGGNELTLSPGVTVIYGSNDSGKTRFSKALSGLLWQNVNCGAKDFLWEKVFLSSTLSSGDDAIRIIRNKNKSCTIKRISGGDSEISISETMSSGNIRIPRDILVESSEKLAKELFRFSPGSFEATSLLISPLDGPLSPDTPCIHQYFTDDGSMFIHAFDTLRSSDSPAHKALVREISDHEAEYKRIRKEIDIIDLSSTRTRKLREESEQIIKDIEMLDRRIRQLADAEEQISRYRKKTEEIIQLTSEIECIANSIHEEKEKISAFNITKGKLEKVFPQFSNFNDIQRNNLSKIQNVFIAIKHAHDRYDHAIKDYKAEGIKCIKRIITAGILLFPAPIAMLVSGFGKSETLKIAVVLSGIGLFIVTVVFSFVSAHSGRKKIPIERETAKKEETENELRNILKENLITINAFSINEAYEFLLQYFEEYGSFSEQEDEAHSLGETLKDDAFFDEMKTKLTQLKQELKQCSTDAENCLQESSNLSGYGSCDNPGALSEFISIEMKTLNEQKNTHGEINEKLSSEIEREEPRSDSESLNDSYNRIGKRIRELNDLKASIEYAGSLLEKSSQQRKERLLAKAVKRALLLFHELTLNRYISRINEEVFLAFINSSTTYEDLTAGHSMLLAFKFAMTDIMEEESIIPPLILDEPTANMDGERIKKFIEITAHYAEKRQIIILTHNREAYQGIFPIVEFTK